MSQPLRRRSVQTPSTAALAMLKAVWAWGPLWFSAGLALGLLAAFYVVFLQERIWLTSQAIVVRDEAGDSALRLGRFATQADLRLAQETVGELARNHQVVREALEQVGPDAKFRAADGVWPSSKVIEQTARSAISVHPPKGVEFGASEVIYVNVLQPSQERSLALNQALCQALEQRLAQVRTARAESVVRELTQSVEQARQAHRDASERVHVIEQQLGDDLADLRGLTEVISANGSRLGTEQLQLEMRQAEAERERLSQELAQLEQAAADPERFVNAPGGLLSNHPGLRKLREGLVEAQLEAVRLQGRYTEQHPKLQAAQLAVDLIVNQLNGELQAVVESARQSLLASGQQIERLERDQRLLVDRNRRLADVRIDYDNAMKDMRARSDLLKDQERKLADARASQLAAQAASLIGRIDGPVLADRPQGPGRTVIVAGSTIAGWLAGIGLVILLTPLEGVVAFGRRASDFQGGRRAVDSPAIDWSNLTSALTAEGNRAEASRGPDRRRNGPRETASGGDRRHAAEPRPVEPRSPQPVGQSYRQPEAAGVGVSLSQLAAEDPAATSS